MKDFWEETENENVKKENKQKENHNNINYCNNTNSSNYTCNCIHKKSTSKRMD